MSGATASLYAAAILAITGLGAFAAGRRGRGPTILAAIGAVLAAAAALPGAIAVLAGAPPEAIAVHWAPPIDELRFGLDPLSAFFAVPLLVLGAICGVYGAFYLDDQRERRWLAAPACFYNLLVGSMLLVLLARDTIGLLVAWELMTLASYALVAFDHAQPDVRRAGWIYLVASHLGVGCLVAAFLVVGDGGLSFDAIALHAPSSGRVAVAAALALVGFGVKAGIVPLHVWLPEAHAAAPSHVSALMSGVMIELGLYGVLRMRALVGSAIPWGPLLLGLGVAGALVGIALALYQRDLKRVLAYSSVENIGVALIGLGVGLWAVDANRPAIAALGLAGGLFHVWTHAAMKGLLFLGAGSIAHGAGTRDLEQMGGLAHRMPRTATLVILGSVAIAALPPLAGFASEWLMYVALAKGGVIAPAGSGLLLLFAIAALAMVGAMSALCFVRWIGIALLGRPRSDGAAHAHESRDGFVVPMALLAIAVVALPFAIPWLADALEPVLAEIAGAPVGTAIVGETLAPVAKLGAALWVGGGIAYVLVRRLVRDARPAPTWGCGYAAPSPRMQYTAASFAEGIHRILPRILRAKVAAAPPAELFPKAAELSADLRDPFTRAAYEPLLDRIARRFGQLRWVQQGLLHLYILYIVAAVVVGLAAVSIRDYVVLP